jgi:hypothetical protein
MRVSVERSGGFAGIVKTASVDEDELSPDEARTMGELVRALGPAEQAGDTDNTQRDRFEYAVTVETNEGSRTITAGEAEASAPLRQLIDWVTATAGRSG